MSSDAEVARLEERVAALTRRLDQIEPKLDTLLAFMLEQKGGWKLLLLLGSIAGAIGAALNKLWLVLLR